MRLYRIIVLILTCFSCLLSNAETNIVQTLLSLKGDEYTELRDEIIENQFENISTNDLTDLEMIQYNILKYRHEYPTVFSDFDHMIKENRGLKEEKYFKDMVEYYSIPEKEDNFRLYPKYIDNYTLMNKHKEYNGLGKLNRFFA